MTEAVERLERILKDIGLDFKCEETELLNESGQGIDFEVCNG